MALVMATSLAFAQGTGSSTTLSGLVTDAQKAVIPGADILAKNNATAQEFRAVTDEGGRFTIAAVPPGTYTVTVTLMGFKTAQLPDVTVLTATPASVNVTLDVGQLEETVVVTGATEIVQTQSANVATTLQVKQLQQLRSSRTRRWTRSSACGRRDVGQQHARIHRQRPADNSHRHHAGRRQCAGQARQRRFLHVHPADDGLGRGITVSTSTPGAEASGGGSAVIRMETRAGSNRFSGSVYNTWRTRPARPRKTPSPGRTRAAGSGA